MKTAQSLPLYVAAETAFAPRVLVESGVGPYVQRKPGASPAMVAELPAGVDRVTLARTFAAQGPHKARAQAMRGYWMQAALGAAIGFAAFGAGVALNLF